MRIPSKIKIAGKTFDVVFDKKFCELEKCVGMMVSEESKIYLKGPRHSQETKITFLHECVHAINVCLSKNYSVNDKEDYVNPMAELLYQIFKQIENK